MTISSFSLAAFGFTEILTNFNLGGKFFVLSKKKSGPEKITRPDLDKLSFSVGEVLHFVTIGIEVHFGF